MLPRMPMRLEKIHNKFLRKHRTAADSIELVAENKSSASCRPNYSSLPKELAGVGTRDQKVPQMEFALLLGDRGNG